MKITDSKLITGPGPVYWFPSPEMLAEAIQSADRCPRFYGDDLHPEPCDGLEGCARCITLLADEIARLA